MNEDDKVPVFKKWQTLVCIGDQACWCMLIIFFYFFTKYFS